MKLLLPYAETWTPGSRLSYTTQAVVRNHENSPCKIKIEAGSNSLGLNDSGEEEIPPRGAIRLMLGAGVKFFVITSLGGERISGAWVLCDRKRSRAGVRFRMPGIPEIGLLSDPLYHTGIHLLGMTRFDASRVRADLLFCQWPNGTHSRKPYKAWSVDGSSPLEGTALESKRITGASLGFSGQAVELIDYIGRVRLTSIADVNLHISAEMPCWFAVIQRTTTGRLIGVESVRIG